MSEKPAQPAFEPYRVYRQNRSNIEDFAHLTGLSYGLAQQLLFKHPREQLPRLSVPERPEESITFSPADQRSYSIELECGWLSFAEYAEKCNIEPEAVEREAAEGRLGVVAEHPETGQPLVVWPPEMQKKPLSELPEPGKFEYRVAIETSAKLPLALDPADMEGFQRVQEQFLVLGHSLGRPDEVATRAEEMLCQACFLLHWAIFEAFLRSTVEELIKLHPSRIASHSRGRKSALSYEEIFQMSSAFSSVEDLRHGLIQREIERMQADGESVHGLMNFLKSEFKFEDDPYTSWYVLDGQVLTTHYNDLVEFKEVRNALVHHAGTPPRGFFETYPKVPRREDTIAIDEEYHVKADLILSSIAHQIALLIEDGRYDGGD
jgi:hypothetical protein